jgi:uncharacterized membrane protein (UPF0182 family)
MDNVRPLRPRQQPAKPRVRRTRRRIVIAIIVAAVLVVLGASGRLLGVYVDWLWFGEVDYRSVFWTRIVWQVITGAAAFLIFFVIVAVNAEIARRMAPGYRASADGELLEPRSVSFRRYVGIGGLALSVLIAAFAGLATASQWQAVLLFYRKTAFGVSDPIFNHDIGFYVFTLPMWQLVYGLVFGALVVALILAAAVHVVMGGIEYRAVLPPSPEGADREGAKGAKEGSGIPSPFGRRTQRAERLQVPKISIKLGGSAVAHLSAILGVIFIVVGVGQLFQAWGLLYSTAGAIYGAANTDVNVRLLMARVTMVVAFVLAGALIWNVWRRRRWWPATIAVWIVVLILLRGVVPAAYQSLVVNPNQLTKERPYIADNIKATKAAYNLDVITTESLAAESPLTVAKLERNAPTLRNIRLWDPDVLTTSYKQIQGLRPYYTFLDADVDRYTLNGVYRQTMLSARELNIQGLPAQAQTWVNQHMTYTHGFGVAMSAVNQITKDGSPDFLVQDVPPRSVKGLEITEPRIYFGERGTDYTLVKTAEQEFDYPGKTGDVYRQYTGSGGVPISPLLARLAFSSRYGTIKFFTTSSLKSESRIIFRNNIAQRIAAVAPFLKLDADPYMVISEGRLWWIVDAYTVTDRYPYATPEGGLNYIRNSVKIVIDAYNGTMTFYTFDERDPLLTAYRDAFPSLFTPSSEMPKGLMEHVRYPEGIFRIQSSVFATYHVDSPDVLYNKGDQWAIPGDPSQGGEGMMPALYVIMRLPNEQHEEFLQMLPFVPNGRKNMISWLGARSDAPNYGKIVSIQFSQSATVIGPDQVEGFINQDPEISAQRTLWNQEGSQVVMGNLLVVPIEDQLLYVQSLYLQSEQTQLPQLKRVIVFYRTPGAEGANNAQQLVAMEPTLGEALTAAFGQAVEAGGTPGGGGGGGTGQTGGATGGTLNAAARALIARAGVEFEAAQTARKGGDIAEYGRQIEALQKTLQQLEALK